jgi:hypothetical protein
MTNLLSPVRDIFHYTIFPGMWISAGSKRGEPAENLAPGTFPQEREFSTESYPQVWTTLGKTPEIQAGRGICERAFCGKGMLGSRSLASPSAISYNGTNCSAGKPAEGGNL